MPTVNFNSMMFEHSNPSAFQQVFFFLLSLIDTVKIKTEFRDCWPVLERKQEVEFRKKLVNRLKELQKEYPEDIPYCNPSLFQSPGGRKFVAFLQTFSRFVLKKITSQYKEGLLYKPNTKNLKLKKVFFNGLVKDTSSTLKIAVRKQDNIKLVVNESTELMKELSMKYFDLKKAQETLRIKQLEKVVDVDVGDGSSKDLEITLSRFDAKCLEAKQILSQFKNLSETHNIHWENIMAVIDESRTQLKLDFEQFPVELVDKDNLSLTYENMLTKVGSAIRRVLEVDCQKLSLPTEALARNVLKLESQEKALNELNEKLSEIVNQMKKHVEELMAESLKIVS